MLFSVFGQLKFVVYNCWFNFVDILDLSVRLSVCPSVCPSVCLSVCLSVWLSAGMSFWHHVDILNHFLNIVESVQRGSAAADLAAGRGVHGQHPQGLPEEVLLAKDVYIYIIFFITYIYIYIYRLTCPASPRWPRCSLGLTWLRSTREPASWP